jgi:hypothetical protein
MKWKCKRSGNIIELPDSEEDNMKGHDQYEKVIEEPVKAQKKPLSKIDNDTESDSI